MEAGADGLVVYSLASNDAIKNISDLQGKRFGVGHLLSSTTYQLGFHVRILNRSNNIDRCLLIFRFKSMPD